MDRRAQTRWRSPSSTRLATSGTRATGTEPRRSSSFWTVGTWSCTSTNEDQGGGHSEANIRSASGAARPSPASASPARTASVAFINPSYTAANVAASIRRSPLAPSALFALSFPPEHSIRHVPWFHGAAASLIASDSAPSGAPGAARASTDSSLDIDDAQHHVLHVLTLHLIRVI